MDNIKKEVEISVAKSLLGKPSRSALFISSRRKSREAALDFVASSADSVKAHPIRIKGSPDDFLVDLLKYIRQRIILNESVDRSFLTSENVISALLSFGSAHAKNTSFLKVFGDTEPALGIADSGVIESDLIDLLEVIGNEAKASRETFVLIVDDLHLLSRENLAAVLAGIHRCAQRNLPVIIFGSGVKAFPNKAISLKGYAERLFLFHFVD